MTHQDIQARLSALLDNELPPEETQAITAHLAQCEACRQAHAAMLAMQNWLRRDALQPLPPGLAEQLSASLEPAVASLPPAVLPPAAAAPRSPQKTVRHWPGWLWPSFTGIGGVLAGAVLMAVLLPQAPSSQNQLAQEVLAGHIRALQAAHLSDVISTDQHTVKPWFAGKLDFSPPVHDLASAGFPLAGGRLDYLNQRPVAALVYRYKLHVINVYVWPAAGTTSAGNAPTERTQQGYQMLAWQQEGMNCWAVSDLNAGDLGRFAGLLRAAGKAGG